MEQLLFHPVYHQMQPARPKLPQLHYGMLGVPQGGGVLCGNDHAAIRRADRQTEPLAQTCRCVQQAVIKLLANLGQHQSEVQRGDARSPHPHRRGQQIEIRHIGVADHRRFQGTAVQRYIGKIHQGAVSQSQSEVQIPQADVAVHAQHALAAEGQRRADACGQGGFPGAALAGHNSNTLSVHGTTSFQFLL